MSDKKSTFNQEIDDISGSKTSNERAWAVGFGVAAKYYTGGDANGAEFFRLGAAVGHGAHETEKTLHKTGKEVSKLNPFKKH